MKIAVGADERLGVAVRALEILNKGGHETIWYGLNAGETMPWPQVARLAAEDVAQGRADEGILFCWTGTGVSIAANKIPGIRAALCVDAETARGARLWNNANVLCLSLRLTSEIMLEEIMTAWFKTSYQPNPTDETCLKIIEQLDEFRKL